MFLKRKQFIEREVRIVAASLGRHSWMLSLMLKLYNLVLNKRCSFKIFYLNTFFHSKGYYYFFSFRSSSILDYLLFDQFFNGS